MAGYHAWLTAVVLWGWECVCMEPQVCIQLLPSSTVRTVMTHGGLVHPYSPLAVGQPQLDVPATTGRRGV
jgi:hypothetical protein